jgi:site-specific DNA-methyltransferase (adenine-specific)
MQPYYQEQNITIYHARAEDVLPTLEAGSIDAVICDPPYGTTACVWDSPIPFASMWEQLRRLVKPRGAIVLFGSQPFTSALVMSNPKWFRYEWIWEKDQGTGYLNANRNPMKVHENIMVFYDGLGTYNPQKRSGKPYATTSGSVGGFVRDKTVGGYLTMSDGARFPVSVLRFYGEQGLHPTQKPVALMEYLIQTYTNPGDVILDFTMGSGTTLRAAKNLGRACIGIETERQYVDIAVDRLAQEVLV